MALQLGQKEQAEAELLALLKHKGASAAQCLAGLSAFAQNPRCSALKPAVDTMLERFAEEVTVPVRMVDALLGASENEKVTSPACETVSSHVKEAGDWSLFLKLCMEDGRGLRLLVCVPAEHQSGKGGLCH